RRKKDICQYQEGDTVYYFDTYPDHTYGVPAFVFGLDISQDIHTRTRDIPGIGDGAYMFHCLRKRADGEEHHAAATQNNDRYFFELARVVDQYYSGTRHHGGCIVCLSMVSQERWR